MGGQNHKIYLGPLEGRKITDLRSIDVEKGQRTNNKRKGNVVVEKN